MDLIQQACVQLAGHENNFVRETAERIAVADQSRDDEMIVLQGRLSTAHAQIKTLKAEIKRKEGKINKLQRMQFGQSSEKLGPSVDSEPSKNEQIEPGQSIEAGGTAISQDALNVMPRPKKPRGKRGRQKVTIPAHLRHEVVVVEPKTDQFCSCGCAAARLGEQVIKKLAYRPAEVYVVEERYPKYSCRKCNRFVQAKVPERVFDYSRFDDSMSLAAVISKFADFLPHYRLQQIFGRSGICVNRSTLWRLTKRAGEILKPLYEALVTDLQASSKLFMDETSAPLLVPGLGRTKTCYLWAMCRDDRRWNGNQPPATAFRFATRAGRHGEAFLGSFSGVLQVDGYTGYNRLTDPGRIGGLVTLANCWVHVRRKFFDAWKETGAAEAWVCVQTIDQLFEVESRIRGQPPIVRQAERERLSKSIVDDFFEELIAISGRILMKSGLGEAINYTLKLKKELSVFLSDGRVEMDNNPVENVIRPIALLRKNSLFAGSETGGEIWAIMASLIGTCKLNGVEPFTYFKWVFEKLAGKLPLAKYSEILPWNCPIGRYSEDPGISEPEYPLLE